MWALYKTTLKNCKNNWNAALCHIILRYVETRTLPDSAQAFSTERWDMAAKNNWLCACWGQTASFTSAAQSPVDGAASESNRLHKHGCFGDASTDNRVKGSVAWDKQPPGQRGTPPARRIDKAAKHLQIGAFPQIHGNTERRRSSVPRAANAVTSVTFESDLCFSVWKTNSCLLLKAGTQTRLFSFRNFIDHYHHCCRLRYQ